MSESVVVCGALIARQDVRFVRLTTSPDITGTSEGGKSRSIVAGDPYLIIGVTPGGVVVTFTGGLFGGTGGGTAGGKPPPPERAWCARTDVCQPVGENCVKVEYAFVFTLKSNSKQAGVAESGPAAGASHFVIVAPMERTGVPLVKFATVHTAVTSLYPRSGEALCAGFEASGSFGPPANTGEATATMVTTKTRNETCSLRMREGPPWGL